MTIDIYQNILRNIMMSLAYQKTNLKKLTASHNEAEKLFNIHMKEFDLLKEKLKKTLVELLFLNIKKMQ